MHGRSNPCIGHARTWRERNIPQTERQTTMATQSVDGHWNVHVERRIQYTDMAFDSTFGECYAVVEDGYAVGYAPAVGWIAGSSPGPWAGTTFGRRLAPRGEWVIRDQQKFVIAAICDGEAEAIAERAPWVEQVPQAELAVDTASDAFHAVYHYSDKSTIKQHRARELTNAYLHYRDVAARAQVTAYDPYIYGCDEIGGFKNSNPLMNSDYFS